VFQIHNRLELKHKLAGFLTRMKKILIIVGTRPEAIKMAPLIRAFGRLPRQFHTKVCATAQHREMLDQVFKVFKLKPDFDLDAMHPQQDLFDLSARLMLGLRDTLADFRPDLVLIQGDTTTSLMAALAAFYLQIPVAHVEAGLRTHNPLAPWPEEMNRQINGCIADIHFAPTENAKRNLINENVSSKQIFVTGNTGIDALFAARQIIQDHGLAPTLHHTVMQCLKGRQLDFDHSKLLLVTGHRRENFGRGFENICHALRSIAADNPDVHIVYPVHLNPNVQKPVRSILDGKDNIHLIEPLDYLPFLFLMDKAYFILTDSGGIQEEAPSLGKPVLVMRESTERTEALHAGTVQLVGTDPEKIGTESQRLIDDRQHYNHMSKAQNPYGDGTAAQAIVKTVLSLNGRYRMH
jgi:UDP-N-acetylglucosamine 2-epimerase (non-hydrolysing)